MRKVKGFRKEFLLAKARTMKKHGACLWDVVSFLCQRGYGRAMATQVAKKL